MNDNVIEWLRNKVKKNESSLNDIVPQIPKKANSHNFDGLRAKFAIVDDDGKKEVYTKLMPYLNGRGIKFSTCVIPTRIGSSSNYMSVADLQAVTAAGNKIISHTYNHTNLLDITDEPTLLTEIRDSKLAIEALGFDCDVIAYPNGSYNNAVIDMVRKYYKCAVSTSGRNVHPEDPRINTQPLDTYAIKRIGVGAYYSEVITYESIKLQIDETIAKGTIGVLMTHVADTDETGWNHLVSAIDYIESLGYKIDDFDTAYEAHKNIIEAGNGSYKIPDKHFAIGSNGEVNGNAAGVVVMGRDDQYTNTDLPSEYPQNHVTINYVNTSVAASSGLPGGKEGILTAYCIGGKNSWYRTWKLASPSMLYIQRVVSDTDNWDAWKDINDNLVIQEAQDTYTVSSTPNSLPAGKIVKCPQSSTASASLPDGASGGMLTIDRTASTSTNTREEWRPYASNNIYIRKASGANTWGGWYKIEPIAVV